MLFKNFDENKSSYNKSNKILLIKCISFLKNGRHKINKEICNK